MIFYGTTDIGLKRIVNQDNYATKKYSDNVVSTIVCDGMGGTHGGDIASKLAIEAFSNYLDSNDDIVTTGYREDDADEIMSDLLRNAVDRANTAVYSQAAASQDLLGMGTTLVAAIHTPKKIYAVNVGDSRIYTLHNTRFTQISKDHSYVQYLVDIGKMTPSKARSSSQKNIITRAIGTEPDVEADIYILDVPSGANRFITLLCTDGLSNNLEPSEMAKILIDMKDTGYSSLVEAADNMVSIANDRGGSDNITIVILAY